MVRFFVVFAVPRTRWSTVRFMCARLPCKQEDLRRMQERFDGEDPVMQSQVLVLTDSVKFQILRFRLPSTTNHPKYWNDHMTYQKPAKDAAVIDIIFCLLAAFKLQQQQATLGRGDLQSDWAALRLC